MSCMSMMVGSVTTLWLVLWLRANVLPNAKMAKDCQSPKSYPRETWPKCDSIRTPMFGQLNPMSDGSISPIILSPYLGLIISFPHKIAIFQGYSPFPNAPDLKNHCFFYRKSQ